jgi:hypothetical protein
MNNIFNNHPIIPNSNQYNFESKYLSVHSEDRDLIKYPKSTEFEITLPQDYLNVTSVRLYSWSFPANYNVFSIPNNNVTLQFKFVNLYNPGEHTIHNVLTEGIFAALNSYIGKEYVIEIETGFYNTIQMPIELTNKMNEAVTNQINAFFDDPANSAYNEAKLLFSSYNRFKVVYNSVSQNMWFGNSADQFVLVNGSNSYYKDGFVDSECTRRTTLPEAVNWGLPSYLGFTRCDAVAYSGEEYLETTVGSIYNSPNVATLSTLSNQTFVPRFYYGDAVPGSGDEGFWLIPSEIGATVYYLQAPFKINIMGAAYIYMEIDGMNVIDETIPWNLNKFTAHTNQTSGVVNSAFAKIAVPTTPISQWFDNSPGPYKYWTPPAERISKLKIKIRYHNGQLVEFGKFEYSFMIEINTLTPQQQRSSSIRDAYRTAQLQSF